MKRAPYRAFALRGVIWGSNFIFMKWAAENISPNQSVLLRVVFAFPHLLFRAGEAGAALGTSRHVHHFVVMSLLATAVYYLAFAAGKARLRRASRAC